jgi:prepilin-type N-terminal cleavage/methylation domain-containing protein
MKRRGFTLVEICAVVAIMGLLAMAAVLSLAYSIRIHRLEDVCQELSHADALVRSAARQSGSPGRLVFDLDQRLVSWQTDDKALPAVLVRLAADDAVALREAELQSSSGQVVVDCSADGYSPDYALTLNRPGESPRWMIVSGLSGQVTWTTDEKRADAIFQTLARRGLAGAELPAAPAAPAAGTDAH